MCIIIMPLGAALVSSLQGRILVLRPCFTQTFYNLTFAVHDIPHRTVGIGEEKEKRLNLHSMFFNITSSTFPNEPQGDAGVRNPGAICDKFI